MISFKNKPCRWEKCSNTTGKVDFTCSLIITYNVLKDTAFRSRKIRTMSRNNDVVLSVSCILISGRSDETTGRLFNRGKTETPTVFPLPVVNMPTLKHSEMKTVKLSLG